MKKNSRKKRGIEDYKRRKEKICQLWKRREMKEKTSCKRKGGKGTETVHFIGNEMGVFIHLPIKMPWDSCSSPVGNQSFFVDRTLSIERYWDVFDFDSLSILK